ncbi:TVP38/TMEM64 family protein [Clostridium paridis]|uniref:TVP38/TMEM64 family membrane protein n=1 Tax=Clostridium paridis TaxID=2803863 RepID=A0A937K1G1_9CLOT|nr:VTT domain-containing protein [Clostridium paridis]MBL4930401.1 TVP38/TMEM64 family protein [Clostridium paridis]
MILGGVIFNPWEGFILTLISIILSETAIYFISKIFLGSSLQCYLIKKYPKLYKLLLKSNVKILSIGILCPIAPSDIACFLASSTGLSYRNFIITIIISNMPMMLLYSFLGNSVLSSVWYSLFIILIIIIICCYSTYLWKKAQKQHQLA